MNKINATETSIEHVQFQYLKKKYNNEHHKPNELDSKIIDAIFNLRKNYNEGYKKRQCIIFLEESPVSLSTLEKQSTQAKKSIKEKNAKPNIEIEQILCCAIKMNGEKCTSKIKEGCFVVNSVTGENKPVCGRHKPK